MHIPAAPAVAALPGGLAPRPAGRDPEPLAPRGDGFDVQVGLRVLDGLERIPKQSHRYRVLGHSEAPDGRLYLLYGETGGSAGYVSRTGADGGIEWEAPVEAPRCLAADDRGGVLVAGDRELVRFTPGGGAVEQVPGPGGPPPVWIEPGSGGVVGIEGQRLVASPGVALPAAVQGRPVETFAVSPGGDSLHVGTEAGWGEVRIRGGSRFFPAPSDPSTPGVWLFTDDVHPLTDGDAVFEIHRTVQVPMRPFVGGILMPNHRGPRDPRCDYDTRISLRRCAPDGTTRWETPTLGRILEVDVAPDGSAWAASESHGQRGENTIWRVLPDGTVGGKVDVSGPVHALVAQGDEAFVSHSNRISSVGSGGRVSPVPGTEGWRARAVVGDGRLLVVDEAELRAALVDPRSGAMVPLTDLQADHVLGRHDEIERAVETAPQPGEISKPTVLVEDEWIQVGGVRVPRQSAG